MGSNEFLQNFYVGPNPILECEKLLPDVEPEQLIARDQHVRLEIDVDLVQSGDGNSFPVY